MTWVFVVVVVVAMGGIALVAAGRGAPMSVEHDDSPDLFVPAHGDLTGRDLRRARFPVVLRGYRMAEVDELLSRLASQLEAHAPVDGSPDPSHQPAAEPADELGFAPERREDAPPAG
ncbi:DivIVA domain-containing protein [Nocardioides sp. 1609]|uniref:DivIVA domain-containing protein n=1 Tax=Nocardioides sp. 1609 TaxID=2508327 RepID=UPI001FD7168D|nr:DivIVA domain-containing protein [Nocardioides sp. 1609]